MTFSITAAMLVVVVAITAPLPCPAADCLAPGSLDPTFNANTNGFSYSTYPVWALALDTQGRVYAAGELSTGGAQSGAGVVRLRADSTWDQTFRSPWRSGRCLALAMQPDQQLLVVGETRRM